MSSSLYESWITRLKVSWMGQNAQRIFGGFAASLGDKSYDWAMQGLLEHLPQYASDPASITLEASERQLDTYPGEPASAVAARAPYWLIINKFRGRGLGILLGLHFSGFDGAILIQQNGRALSLSLPLPPFSGNWDPTPNLVIQSASAIPSGMTVTSSLTPPTISSAGRSIPGTTPWASFDWNTDMCSRFVILFPGRASRPATYGTATFTGVEDGGAVPWPIASWPTPLSTVVGYDVIAGPAKVTGTNFPLVVSADATSKTSTGVRVMSSYPFTGSVDVKAIAGVDTAAMKKVVQKWKNAKSTCVGVFELRSSAGCCGWPVQTFGSGMKSGDTSINQLLGRFT
jgi:hypothetical protein